MRLFWLGLISGAAVLIGLMRMGEPTPLPAPVPTAAADISESPLTLQVPVKKGATSRPTSRATSRPSSRPTLAKAGTKKKDKDCETGCAATPSTEPAMTQKRLQQLLQAYASEPLKPGSKALEVLLFHGYHLGGMMPTKRPFPLSKKHWSFLQKELKKTHARLSFRIVDEFGVKRISFDQKIKIGGHFHVEAKVHKNIQRPGFGGKIKRVGLNHLWVRI